MPEGNVGDGPTHQYDKPALSHEALLQRWVSRGLKVGDPDRAMRYLRTIGYYRLSVYVRSFEAGQRDVLAPGTTFDDVLALYVFDRKLRLLVMDPLERIEVALRAGINDRMGAIGGPHWYLDRTHFKDVAVQKRLVRDVRHLVEVQRERGRRKDHSSGGVVTRAAESTFPSALEHYVARYDEPSEPPTWVTLEELTLGHLVHMYGALADQGVRADLAKSLGVKKVPVFDSWLRTWLRIRNICAHHGRLWNRGLGVLPALPKSRDVPWLEDRDLFVRDLWRKQRLYPVLVSLQTVLYEVSPRSAWRERLGALMDVAPARAADGMGMPAGWRDDAFWGLPPRDRPGPGVPDCGV